MVQQAVVFRFVHTLKVLFEEEAIDQALRFRLEPIGSVIQRARHSQRRERTLAARVTSMGMRLIEPERRVAQPLVGRREITVRPQIQRRVLAVNVRFIIIGIAQRIFIDAACAALFKSTPLQ